MNYKGEIRKDVEEICKQLEKYGNLPAPEEIVCTAVKNYLSSKRKQTSGDSFKEPLSVNKRQKNNEKKSKKNKDVSEEENKAMKSEEEEDEVENEGEKNEKNLRLIDFFPTELLPANYKERIYKVKLYDKEIEHLPDRIKDKDFSPKSI